MGFNQYKELPKIKEDLKKRGYKKKIPIDIFGKTLMLLYGMKKETAVKWISNFEDLSLIRVSKGMVYFLGGD